MLRLPIAFLLLILAGPVLASDEVGVRASAEIEAGLYGETGRLTIRLGFRVEQALTERYQVLLHIADAASGAPLAVLDHVPPVPTDKWPAGETVHYTLTGVVDRDRRGGRPPVLVLVALVDPTLENPFKGRLKLEGDAPFIDRRYVLGRVEASATKATPEDLRGAARELAERGETAQAFDLLAEALTRAADMDGKLAVTADLLALEPPPGAPVTGPEEVIVHKLVSGEKLRWLRDRASDLLKQQDLRVALKVLEQIGGVVEEGRNTRVVGEPTGEERAKKDIVDIKYRLLRDLPKEQLAESGKIVEKTGGNTKKLFAAAKEQLKKGKPGLARRLAFEAQLDIKAPDRLKDQIGEFIAELEHRILYDLTPEEQQRLAQNSDHPAFHRTGFVATSRFVYLGPEGLVKAIPRASTHKLDVAFLLLTDLFGRSPVKGGERIFVYFKETYSGPATGGGRNITVGDADPADRKTRVDNGLYYHELTHCVDDTRPVHDYKRGLTEGIANVGALFVRDMFTGPQGRFEEMSKGGRAAFARHHLDRENAYWLIPAYAPSEGMLTEILVRHAMLENGHPDWPRLGEALRAYRRDGSKNERTNRIMAHLGHALAEAIGEPVWDTLEEFRFPVSRDTGREMRELMGSGGMKLLNLARRRDARGLAEFADQTEPAFVAAQARYAALAGLDAAGLGDSSRAVDLRRKLGVIDRMHVIGPFSPQAGPGLAEMFEPDFRIDFEDEFVTPHGVARWLRPEAKAEHFARMDARGVVRLRYGYPDLAVTYAIAHVTVPEATDALAWLGADDEIALWVNGVQVQRNHGRRSLVPDWERWPIRLKAGRNRIRVKVANQHGGTGFCLRITDAVGLAIDGLTTDLDPVAPLPAPPEHKWEYAFRDTFRRRQPGKAYEVVRGKFDIRNKILFGEENGRHPGWRPFSVRPGFPQDTPVALLWLLATPKSEPPADFLLKLGLAKEASPRIAVTWDGEGGELPLSGWSLVLTEKNGRITARLERYDYLHYVTALDAPREWSEPTLEIRRIADKVTVTLGGTPIFTEVSCPPLKKRRVGLAVWGKEPGLVSIQLAHPR